MSEQPIMTEVTDRKTLRHIEMQQPDGSWLACTSPRADPREVVDIWDFRENDHPDDVNRVIRTDISVEDIDAVRELVPPRTDEDEKTAVHSD